MGMNIMDTINKFWINLKNFIDLNVVHRSHMLDMTKEIIDVLFLSIIFYCIIKFIINRRAFRLFLGIIILALVMLLAYLLELRITTWFFQSFYQIGFTAIIIMFQPELRSALEKIGNAPISNIKNISKDNKSSSYVANSIGIITNTAYDLAETKTGALIVIERETKLGEHIKTGTFINAQLSSQLLKNVFFNKAPLHDGAVILRNYRLYSAGCFLPLSTNESIDENMGTRHRAAIGISEVSDAIAIVVSEETGKISIAIDGELIQGFTQKTLRKELSKLLIPNTNNNNTQNKNSNNKNLSNKSKLRSTNTEKEEHQ